MRVWLVVAEADAEQRAGGDGGGAWPHGFLPQRDEDGGAQCGLGGGKGPAGEALVGPSRWHGTGGHGTGRHGTGRHGTGRHGTTTTAVTGGATVDVAGPLVLFLAGLGRTV